MMGYLHFRPEHRRKGGGKILFVGPPLHSFYLQEMKRLKCQILTLIDFHILGLFGSRDPRFQVCDLYCRFILLCGLSYPMTVVLWICAGDFVETIQCLYHNSMREHSQLLVNHVSETHSYYMAMTMALPASHLVRQDSWRTLNMYNVGNSTVTICNIMCIIRVLFVS